MMPSLLPCHQATKRKKRHLQFRHESDSDENNRVVTISIDDDDDDDDNGRNFNDIKNENENAVDDDEGRGSCTSHSPMRIVRDHVIVLDEKETGDERKKKKKKRERSSDDDDDDDDGGGDHQYGSCGDGEVCNKRQKTRNEVPQKRKSKIVLKIKRKHQDGTSAMQGMASLKRSLASTSKGTSPKSCEDTRTNTAVRSDSSDSTSKDTGNCHHCGKVLKGLSTRQRARHLRQCEEEPAQVNSSKRIPKRSNRPTEEGEIDAFKWCCPICRLETAEDKAEIYIKHIRLCSKSNGISNAQMKALVDEVKRRKRAINKRKRSTNSPSLAKTARRNIATDDEIANDSGAEANNNLFSEFLYGADGQQNFDSAAHYLHGNSVEKWLESVSLHQYYDALISNGFDTLQVCAEITEKELEFIKDISKRGHQLRLLTACAQLKKKLALKKGKERLKQVKQAKKERNKENIPPSWTERSVRDNNIFKTPPRLREQHVSDSTISVDEARRTLSQLGRLFSQEIIPSQTVHQPSQIKTPPITSKKRSSYHGDQLILNDHGYCSDVDTSTDEDDQIGDRKPTRKNTLWEISRQIWSQGSLERVISPQQKEKSWILPRSTISPKRPQSVGYSKSRKQGFCRNHSNGQVLTRKSCATPSSSNIQLNVDVLDDSMPPSRYDMRESAISPLSEEDYQSQCNRLVQIFKDHVRERYRQLEEQVAAIHRSNLAIFSLPELHQMFSQEREIVIDADVTSPQPGLQGVPQPMDTIALESNMQTMRPKSHNHDNQVMMQHLDEEHNSSGSGDEMDQPDFEELRRMREEEDLLNNDLLTSQPLSPLLFDIPYNGTRVIDKSHNDNGNNDNLGEITPINGNGNEGNSSSQQRSDPQSTRNSRDQNKSARWDSHMEICPASAEVISDDQPFFGIQDEDYGAVSQYHAFTMHASIMPESTDMCVPSQDLLEDDECDEPVVRPASPSSESGCSQELFSSPVMVMSNNSSQSTHDEGLYLSDQSEMEDDDTESEDVRALSQSQKPTREKRTSRKKIPSQRMNPSRGKPKPRTVSPSDTIPTHAFMVIGNQRAQRLGLQTAFTAPAVPMPDFGSMSIEELKARIRKYGLKSSQSKGLMVEQLQQIWKTEQEQI